MSELFGVAASSWTISAIRTHNALARSGIRSIGALVSKTPLELLSVKNFGPRGYQETIASLHRFLGPWLPQLGNIEAAEESAPASSTLAQQAETDELAPEPGGSVEAELSEPCMPEPLALLDRWGVVWRNVTLAEIDPDFSHDSLLLGIILGDVLDPAAEANDIRVPPNVTMRVSRAVRRWLATQLVGHALQTDTSVHDGGLLTPLQDVSVESLLNELLDRCGVGEPHQGPSSPNTKARAFDVLLSRYGVRDGRTKTLAKLGESYGVTRERVRQLAQRAEERLQEPDVSPYLCGLSTLAAWAVRAEGGVSTVEAAGQRIASWLPFGSLNPTATVVFLAQWSLDVIKREGHEDYLVASPYSSELVTSIEEDAEIILRGNPGGLPYSHLVDQVMLAGGNETFTAGRDLVSAVIGLSGLVDINGDYCLPARHGAALQARIIAALRDLGHPAHFTEITERFNSLYPDSQRSDHAVHSYILRFPNIFVRVGNGIYGLAGDEYQAELTVADALLRILEESDRPLHVSEVVARAEARYHWTEHSLHAGLQSNSRIKRFGNAFFGLANRDYPGFDPVKAYADLFGYEKPIKERLVQAAVTNERNHPVVQVKLTAGTVQGFLHIVSRPLRDLFPVEGTFVAEAVSTGQAGRQLRLRRGRYDISGLRKWFLDIDAQPGDLLFIEGLTDASDAAAWTYRLVHTRQDNIGDAMRAVGLTPAPSHTASTSGHSAVRHAWKIGKVLDLLSYTLAHPWTAISDVNAVLGFSPGSPHGTEYVCLAELRGLLARGLVTGCQSEPITRPTLLGRAWLAGYAEWGLAYAIDSLLLPLAPYRAHLRARALNLASRHHSWEAPDPVNPALIDATLAERWDTRLELTGPDSIYAALERSVATVPTALLPGPAVGLILLLIAAQTHGFGISLPALEACGLTDPGSALRRLRFLGVNLVADAEGRLALREPANLTIVSSDDVAQHLQAIGGQLGGALWTAWFSTQRVAWPRRSVKASALYDELMAVDQTLLNQILVPPPASMDPSARFADGEIVPCPFMSLVADWGWSVTDTERAPFAFLRHANALVNGMPADPVAVCLCPDLLSQPWNAQSALAADAHLALLTLAAGDVGGLADQLVRDNGGWFIGQLPLVGGLDHILRQLGYEVWDDHYRGTGGGQVELGDELVARGERLGLLTLTSRGLESTGSLAAAIYYDAYDVLIRMQQALAAPVGKPAFT